MAQEQIRPRWSPPRGRVALRAAASDPTQEYLLYVPRDAAPGAPVMVSVHGISRNATKHPVIFAEMCEKLGVVMVVPIFKKDAHRDYQRLGRKGRGKRADLLLHRLLAEVTSLSGADVTRIHLFGFSGGGQFAHRYAMAHPHRVAKVVVAAAGWYTFPDPQQRFPYGIRQVRALEGIAFDPEAFLRVPMRVLVGSLDTTMENTRNTARTVAQQGATRLDRARRWVTAMQDAATALGLEPQVTLAEVPDIGHSFTAFCERGKLVDLVRQALFGDASFRARRARPRDEPIEDSPASTAPGGR
ncbi:MAG TPA: hypothetical protein VKD28_05780 [Gemmatimonadales bacterium]|nr:hypothetical protein [Gemmatimonadales bacterium]